MIEYWNGIPIIDDSTDPDLLFNPQYARGAEPRDYTVDPEEMFEAPSGIKVIPQSEWSARIDEQNREKSSCADVWERSGAIHLNQGSYGYCWSHSVTHAVMVSRLMQNQPHVPLSAFAVAATIKSGRNEGGWCGLSAKFARERGIPSQEKWPQGRADWRAFDRPDVWEDAKRFLVTEDWFDLTRPVHGQVMTFEQVATCLLSGVPVAADFMWWRHSVTPLQLVQVEPGSFGLKILNSWLDWGEKGFGILRGSRARPDAAVAIRTTVLSGLRNVA